jgi:hypothetical protein
VLMVQKGPELILMATATQYKGFPGWLLCTPAWEARLLHC